jgi:hypothetical protein
LEWPPAAAGAPRWIFHPFQAVSDFSNLLVFSLPTIPGRFTQSFSRTVRRSVANGDGFEFIRKSGRTKAGRVNKIPTASPFQFGPNEKIVS